MKYKWTPSYDHLKDNQIKKLDQLLKNKIPITQITRKLNLCSQTIKKYCDDNKINTHQARFKNDWNLKFFNILGSKTAYWAGFLFADGSLRKHAIELTLSAKDKEFIKEYCKAISCKLSKIKYRKSTNAYRVQISKDNIKDDLLKWGIIENKTYKFVEPNFPKELMPHFLRGWFDGDGSISVYKENKSLRIQFDITGGPEHIKFFMSEIKKLGLKKEFYIINKKDNFAKTARVSSTRIDFIKEFHSILKVHQNFHLERKWQKFHEYQNYREKPLLIIQSLIEKRNPKNFSNSFTSESLYVEIKNQYKKDKINYPITKRRVELLMKKSGLISKNFYSKGKYYRRWIFP